MRSTKLHGERKSWNHHLVRWVVRFRWIFLEVWIFRDVGDEFQDFVTHSLAAAAAIRKNGVTHQDHGGARLVLVADFVYPGMLHQLSRSQYAVGLVKLCSVSRIHLLLLCSFLDLGRRGCLRGSRPFRSGMRSEWAQV